MEQIFSKPMLYGGQCIFSLQGRNAWALSALVLAGENGCSPIDNPGPRWSAYVHFLRHELGLSIETISEAHFGQFPGYHARYVLRSVVAIVEGASDAA
jgi:hypothetical protein